MIGITLTGAGERTDVADLIRLADMGAEIGLLYSFSPDGRPRYPSLSWILDAAGALNGRAALHVCGHRARTEFAERNLGEALNLFRRVQVNGRVSPEALAYFADLVMPDDTTLITQHTPQNADLLESRGTYRLVQHALLVDASGGRGLSPAAWAHPETDKPVGFAGGLGPDNLERELPNIAAVARPGAWIDMENKLRDETDWFDAGKAVAVMEIWAEFVKDMKAGRMAMGGSR
jgi:phosphoribosylanthranilate isomerase